MVVMVVVVVVVAAAAVVVEVLLLLVGAGGSGWVARRVAHLRSTHRSQDVLRQPEARMTAMLAAGVESTQRLWTLLLD